MATSMGPPSMLPGYSLRVQLFSSNAYGSGDKPTRSFRVVTSPDVTVQEFCHEASRIHEINYGKPLKIKKVQDDQEFDITQSEILGSLFDSAAIIRMVQASETHSIRDDSVPPTSALRYDPLSRKRERVAGARPNSSSSSWQPNKRQRVLDLDPDQPLPSREGNVRVARANGYAHDLSPVPNPQESVILGGETNFYGHSTDKYGRQSGISGLDDNTNEVNSNPLQEASTRAQSHPARAIGTNYHTQKTFQRGMSASTAATDSTSVGQDTALDGQARQQLRISSSSIIPPPRLNGSQRSSNEKSVYENIVSDDESANILRNKKAALKLKNSPKASLSGSEWSNKKFGTSPSATRRSAQSNTPGELPLTPNSKEQQERERKKNEADEVREARLAAAEAAEEREREADEARQAGEMRVANEERAQREEQERLEVEEFKRNEARAAHLKAEREAKEKRGAEEQKRREDSQARKDKRAEEKRKKEVQAAIEKKAAGERLIQDSQEATEAQRVREVKEKATQEKKDAATAVTQKTTTPERARYAQLSSPNLPQGTPKSRPQSSTPYIPSGRKSALKGTCLSSQALQTSSPDSAQRPLNGVGIETQMPLPRSLGRRVSFRNTPDPAGASTSHESQSDEDSSSREIPTKETTSDRKSKQTPPQSSSMLPLGSNTPSSIILPPAKMAPPKVSTKRSASKPSSKVSTPVVTKPTTKPSPKTSSPEVLAGRIAAPKLSQSTSIIPPPKHSTTPIPPPSMPKRSSKDRSATPVVQSKNPPLQKAASPQVTKTKLPLVKRITAISSPNARGTATLFSNKSIHTVVADNVSLINHFNHLFDNPPTPSKSNKKLSAKPKSASPKPSPPATVEESAAKLESRAGEVDVSGRDLTGSKHVVDPGAEKRYVSKEVIEETEESDFSENEAEEVADPMDVDEAKSQSQNSSGRDSRSPVIFSQHPTRSEPGLLRSASPESKSASDDENADEEDDRDEVEIESVEDENDQTITKVDVDEEEVSSNPASEAEAQEAQFEIAKSSPPVLPKHKRPVRQTVNGGSRKESYSHIIAPSTTTPVPTPASSRPSFRVGASLSSLSQHKGLFGTTPKVQATQQKLQLPQQDDDESEVESEDDSSDDSSDDDAAKSKPASQLPPATQKKLKAEDDSDSDSDSDSSEESETEDSKLMAAVRGQLAREIAGISRPSSQKSDGIKSPKPYVSSTQREAKTKSSLAAFKSQFNLPR